MNEKFYKLKEWLTLEDTAKYLSIELGEDIDISDVLQLAMDKKLKISVNFPHDWYGKICDLTKNEEKVKYDYYEIQSIDEEIPLRVYRYEKCSEDEYIKIFPQTHQFKAGVYEVKLIGNSKIDVEFQFKQAKGLVAEDVFCFSGFYVFNNNGLVIERQSILDRSPYCDIKTRKYIENPFYYPCPSIDEIKGAFFVFKSIHIDEFLQKLVPDIQSSNGIDKITELQAEIDRLKAENEHLRSNQTKAEPNTKTRISAAQRAIFGLLYSKVYQDEVVGFSRNKLTDVINADLAELGYKNGISYNTIDNLIDNNPLNLSFPHKQK